MLTGIRKGLGLLELLWMSVAVLAMLSMMIGISTDALGRYLFGAPLPGNFEFVTYFAMVALAFMGQARTYTQNAHVRLDIMSGLLDRIPFQLSARLNTLLAAIVFGVITWYAGHDALEKIEARETTFGIVQFPLYLSFIWFPLGCLLITVRLAFDTAFPPPRQEATP